MYGIFRESWVIFKEFGGSGHLLALFLLALAALAVTERDRRKRLVLVLVPAVILLIYFLPVTRIVFVAVMDEGNTYYRLLWLLPVSLVIAYAGCRLFSRHRRAGLAATACAVMLCGAYVYNSPYISRAENPYHIPQTVIDICDRIAPEADEARVKAVFPAELIYFVRQYTTDILMPYGREMVEAQWDYYHPVYYAMEKSEVIDVEELAAAAAAEDCRYIVLNTTRQTDRRPEDAGLRLVEEIDAYRIYEIPGGEGG